MAFDHDVLDGGPAARFVQRLVELIETGHGRPVVGQAEPGVPAMLPTAPASGA